MASKKSNKSMTQLFGSIAAAQTMVEQFPFSFGMDEKGFTCTFDLLSAIFNLISDEPLDKKVITVISEKLADSNCTWLQGIEETIKLALELNITNLLTCDMSPIIPDKLIGSGEFLKGSDRAVNFQGEGIRIPVSAIDFTGVLGNCPADENNPVSTSYYFSCYREEWAYVAIDEKFIPKDVEPTVYDSRPEEEKEEYISVNGVYYKWEQLPLTIEDTWKHDDFNAFLWYVKNKGVYGNLVERHKLIWDNRYKTKPYTKYVRKPEHFFTMSNDIDALVGPERNGIFPFSETYLKTYNESPKISYKKKQILECRYIDGDGIQPDSFQFRLPASNYYKTRKLTSPKKETTIWRINKTIFEFNHDFLMSLKLLDAKTYLCQMVSSLLGVGNLSFNFSITRDSAEIEETVDAIIEKVINLDDTEIEDCYYTFSNEEYDQMLQNALMKRKQAQYNTVLSSELIDSIKQIEKSGATFEENKTVISNVLTQLSKEAESGNNVPNGWKFDYDFQFELIRMLVYPLIRPLFSPKVMTLILINLEVMGNPLKLGEKIITFNNVKPYFMGIITNIVVQIKDMINEMLYSWVLEKLTPLLTLFTLRLLMEHLEMYKQLVEDLLTACSFSSFSLDFNRNKKRVGIDNVDYADIYPELEKMKQTAISKTNC